MPIRVRLTTEPDGGICIESLYDASLVNGLKRNIPHSARTWDAQRKRWIVSALYAQEVLALCQDLHAMLTDDRSRETPDMVVPVPAMPEDLRQAFDTLTLAYTAPLELAEVAFRFYSKYYHPDKGGDEALFRQCNDAMAVIKSYLKPPHEDDLSDLPF